MNASIIEDKPIIYIKTLGGFSLRVGDKEITDNSNQSKKPWCLLEYLVVFQKKSISPGAVSYTHLTICGSRAEVGSSNSSTSGSMANALAMATLCFCPPESCLGLALI